MSGGLDSASKIWKLWRSWKPKSAVYPIRVAAQIVIGGRGKSQSLFDYLASVSI